MLAVSSILSFFELILSSNRCRFRTACIVNGQTSTVACVFATLKILTGEDWNFVMYDGIRAMRGLQTTGAVFYCFYFLVLVVFGNCILNA